MNDAEYFLSLGFKDLTGRFNEDFDEIFSDFESERFIAQKKRYSLYLSYDRELNEEIE